MGGLRWVEVVWGGGDIVILGISREKKRSEDCGAKSISLLWPGLVYFWGGVGGVIKYYYEYYYEYRVLLLRVLLPTTLPTFCTAS